VPHRVRARKSAGEVIFTQKKTLAVILITPSEMGGNNKPDEQFGAPTSSPRFKFKSSTLAEYDLDPSASPQTHPPTQSLGRKSPSVREICGLHDLRTKIGGATEKERKKGAQKRKFWKG